MIEVCLTIHGLREFQASMDSLGAVMQTAGWDEGPEITQEDGTCFFDGVPVATFSREELRTGILHLKPGIGLPLLAAHIVAHIPSVRVQWAVGWPLFRLSGGGDHDEPDPILFGPDALAPA